MTLPKRSRPSSTIGLIGTLAACAAFHAGCHRHAARQADGRNAAPVHSVVHEGPVRLRVEAAPSTCRLSDSLTLTIRIEAPPGAKITPPMVDAIEGFALTGRRDPLPRLQDDREVTEQIHHLEPLRTGKIVIPSLQVEYLPPNAPEAASKKKLRSEPLVVQVWTSLPNEAPSLAELAGPAAPISVPIPWYRDRRLYLALATAFILAVLAYGVRRLRQRQRQVRPLSARERARLALDRLLAEGWLDRDPKIFYVELTGIVRSYIESTTGVKAPEQTTEEFLRVIQDHPDFWTRERDRLRDFLEAADLVKFAAHHPQRPAMEHSLVLARRLIDYEAQGEAA